MKHPPSQRRLRRREFVQAAGRAALAAAASLPGCAHAREARPDGRPNVVVIFIDDMGYGDIEPFGSTLNRTPHLNRMAEEGVKLTSFYVAAPLCTPSRAALMTGCYPKRVGLARGSWGGVLFPKDSHGLHPNEVTIAEVLGKAGYATGCFGKWHLGDQPAFLPTRHGFDTYFGIPYSNDMWPKHPGAKRWKHGVCPLPVMRGKKVVDVVEDMDDQAQLCKRFTDEAVTFIRKNEDKPFFVYLPHAFIHWPRQARQAFMDKAGGDATRAQIEEVDWSVGQILQTLRDLDPAQNTLVLFTSDNGGSRGCVNKPLRGGKGNTWEGGMREPTLAWWPGHVPAGAVCDEVASTMDLLPTVARLAGGKAPDDRVIDGKDIAPLLRDPANAKSPHETFFYHQGNNLRAVRAGKWKLHANGGLYDLDADIGEQKNVAKQHPDVVKRLRGYLAECRKDLGNPKNCRPVGTCQNPQYLVPKETG